MIFGTLYGSFFGYEELLDPVFENIGLDFLPLKVFKQTNFILITAVAIGVALIVISMILNIYIGFKNKDYEKPFSAVTVSQDLCSTAPLRQDLLERSCSM